jgi:hypothetical protein
MSNNYLQNIEKTRNTKEQLSFYEQLTKQHFNLLHRSGSNIRPNRVRYTMLARCSNLLAPDFLPISWK